MGTTSDTKEVISQLQALTTDSVPAYYVNETRFKLRENNASFVQGDPWLLNDAKNKNEDGDIFECIRMENEFIYSTNILLNEGRDVLGFLLSYRSFQRVIPKDFKTELNLETQSILLDYISDLGQALNYHKKIIKTLGDSMIHLTSHLPFDKDFLYKPSTAFLNNFVDIIGLLFDLDNVKNLKASINNDLSFFKRATAMGIGNTATSGSFKISPELNMFFAQRDVFISGLKKTIQYTKNFDAVLESIIIFTLDKLFGNSYGRLQRKERMIKTLSVCLYLVDGEGEEKDIFKRKRLKMDRIEDIYLKNPIVQIFGDIHIRPYTIFSKSPYIGTGKWKIHSEEFNLNAHPFFDILFSLSKDKQDFVNCMTEFGTLYSQVSEKIDKINNIPLTKVESFGNAVLRCIRLSFRFHRKLNSTISWKLDNPARNADALSYQTAIEMNLTEDEKTAIGTYLYMSQTLNSTLLEINEKYDILFNNYVYNCLQTFLQVTTADFYHYVTKKKKSITKEVKLILDIFCETSIDQGTVYDSKSKSQVLHIKKRVATLTESQLSIIQTFFETLLNSKIKTSLFKDNDFKESHYDDMENFLFEFDKLIVLTTFKDVVSPCTDYSAFWFKEFCIEMYNSAKVPLSTSLPWLLAENVLNENKNPVELQFLFHPFQIYNSIMYQSLDFLKCQYIYDEIIAEANEAFDKLMLDVAELIFGTYRRHASYKILKIPYHHNFRRKERYDLQDFESILSMETLNIVGRYVSFGPILSKIMNQMTFQSIEMAITKFEQRSLVEGISELHTLLAIFKESHLNLQKFLSLDAFDVILAHIDKTHGLEGRIQNHISKSFLFDLIPNYCYEHEAERFIPSEHPFVETDDGQSSIEIKSVSLIEFGSQELAQHFELKRRKTEEALTLSQFKEIHEALGIICLNKLCDDLIQHLNILMKRVVGPHIQLIHQNFDSIQIDLSKERTVLGKYDLLFQHYQPLMSFKHLHDEVFQVFREIGNIMAIMKLFDSTCLQQMVKYSQFNLGQEHVKQITKIDYADLNLAYISQRPIYPNFTFKFILNLKSNVDQVKNSWLGQPMLSPTVYSPSSIGPPVSSPSSSTAFTTVWTALIFIYSSVKSLNFQGANYRYIYGDAFFWSGACIISLLEQSDYFLITDHSQKLILEQEIFQQQQQVGDLALSNKTNVAANHDNGGAMLVGHSRIQKSPLNSFLDQSKQANWIMREMFEKTQKFMDMRKNPNP